MRTAVGSWKHEQVANLELASRGAGLPAPDVVEEAKRACVHLLPGPALLERAAREEVGGRGEPARGEVLATWSVPVDGAGAAGAQPLHPRDREARLTCRAR